MTDFEYCYKIFSPIEGFHENGIIAKIIKDDGLDLAIGFNLGDSKLGIKIQGAPKPVVAEELKLASKQLAKSEHKSDEDTEDYEDDEDELSWKGLIEVDTFFHPTFTGTLEIDEKDSTYIVISSLTLLNGTALLYDELYFLDVFNITNKFHLTTPYTELKEVHSDFKFSIDLGLEYVAELNIGIKRDHHLIESGVSMKYKYNGGGEDERESDLEIHTVNIKLFTPFELLKLYLLHAQLEIEDNIYHTNLTMATIDSNVTTAGYLQVDDGYVETSVSFSMDSPVYSIPSFQVSGKRDSTHPLKKIELTFEKSESTKQLFKFNGHWNLENSNNIQIGMQISSLHKSIPAAAADLLFINSPEAGSTILYVLLSPLPEHTMKINSTLMKNHISLYLETPVEGYRKMSFDGNLTEEDNLHKIQAVVISDGRKFNMEGSYLSNNNIPLKADLKLHDFHNGNIILLHANVHPLPNGYNMSCGMQNGEDNFNMHGSVHMIHILDFNIYMKATSSHSVYKLVSIDTTVQQQSNRNISVSFNVDSSIPSYEKIRYAGNILFQEHSGELKSHLVTKDINTSFNAEWMLRFFENILLSVNGHFQDAEMAKYVSGKVFFHFPRTSKRNQKKNLTMGIDVNLDKDAWQFGSNGTISFASIENVETQVYFKLPKPNHDIHFLHGKVQLSSKFDNVNILAKYKTLYSNKNYGITCKTTTKKANSETMQGNLKLEYGYGNDQNIDNKWTIEKSNTTFNAIYILRTPYYDENTIKATFSYDTLSKCNHLRAQLFHPESHNITQANIDFSNFNNMNGTIISNTPFEALPYAGINFKVLTQKANHVRFAEVFWPNKTALFDSVYVYEQQHFTTNFSGSLSVEIPLSTRHNGKISYAYMEKPLHKIGHADITYNNKQILEGDYRCDSEVSAGYEKDKIKIDLENELFPLGVLYTHQFHFSGGQGGMNLPTTDIKQTEIFKLHNKTAFHLTGELSIKTTSTGQDIVITAKHLKRVVELKTDYDETGNEFRHRSTLTLDPNSWASYDIVIINKTTDYKDEEHIELNFSYPQRNFTAFGYYQLMNNSLSSELNFVWDKEKLRNRSVGTSLEWKRLSHKPNKQHATFSLKHPSFIKPVTFSGLYFSNNRNMVDVSMNFVYSNDTYRKLSLSGKLEDVSQEKNRKYQYEVVGSHPATSLDLKVKGEIMLESGMYQTQNKANYRRSYIPQHKSELNGKIDSHQKEVHFEKKSNDEISHIKAKYSGKYPTYRINGTMSQGKTLSSIGDFNLHLEDKILFVSVNTTEDESERNFYIVSDIPDSRNALFNVWTDYEDIRVSDVTFYLRLNHSRLVTSKLKWRPELENEIKTRIEELGDQIWNGSFETLDYWTNYIKSEASDAIKDIWRDAQPFIGKFLDDVTELESLKEDYENFKVYLNDSYNNNDFYIQDIVNFCNKLMDDLSIRGHIESLPAFVKEIWEIMGESGEAILKSLRWIIDTIKTSYQKAVQFINNLMRGDLTSRISEIMEKLGEKYDKFIRDLRVAFVKYMTDLWYTASTMLLEHWNSFVLAVEPTFVTIAHYVETIVWKVSTEVLDFLYQRKTELVESPYFSKFANFTQDLDKFYKDIMKNDIITNVRKYSKIIYEFIRDKYFAMVPFGKELEDVANEIITELKVIQKLPSIKYAIDKSNELYDKIVWVYNYLDLGTQIQNALTIIHLKITDITQTALQAENRYREAKTLFIFDPESGNVILEQKLPMSWHAFNETPRFEEIPEYKAVSDLQNYFVSSNVTFWTLYYEYKPYSEPSNWFPPFSAQALIAGTQHFMTFDRTFYEFQGSCTYLLASDFIDRNFSFVMSYDSMKDVHIISIIIDKQIVHIDMFNDLVILNTNERKILPLQIGDTYIYQEASIITVDSAKGFYVECNLKFDVCVIKLSGWYFGKTAGLLGTMDNEPTTDFMTPKGVIENSIEKFTDSWLINQEMCLYPKNKATKNQIVDDELLNKCSDFFKAKSSQFSSCFSRVDSTPFWNMCINSRNSTDKDPCTVAVAYMQACLIENTPLRIPESCIKCRHLVNDIEVPEGDFRQIENESVPRSTDVVFIIQAGSCNSDIKTALSIDVLISSLNKELSGERFISNRYAVVVFGGNGVYNQPRSITVNNNVFANEEHILEYFDYIPTGNGTTDVFEGIRFATQLIFRPGVSKTFILIPCSSCEPSKMNLDYSVLHQVLLENGIKLHILMNDEFYFKKPKAQKVIFGIDKETTYTNKDVKVVRGDSDLRKQVREPKFQLGICSALAMETNGTVFTAKLLQTDKKNIARKLLTVFSKRIASTAEPYPCQKCECTADNNGMSYMECFPCEYPQPSPYSYTNEDIERSEHEEIDDTEETEE